MDPDSPASAPRKMRFAPKGPPRRALRPAATVTEVGAQDNGDEETQRCLHRRAREHLAGRRPRAEKKSSVQVAFTHGVASSAIRTYGKQRERAAEGGSNAAKSEETTLYDVNDTQSIAASISTSASDEDGEFMDDLIDEPNVKKKKEYQEPWDYEHSYYPTTLPWRKPYSGDPELLDKEEFEVPQEYNENTLCAASDLGLLDQVVAPQMLFFQFPSNLPLVKRQTADDMKTHEKSITSKGKEMAGSARVLGNSPVTPSKNVSSTKGCYLEEFPGGYMGKMLVYKSGAVKLKLGDILYDVNPGVDCKCVQSVAAIDTSSRDFCELGELKKHAVVTPDIDHLVDKVVDLG